MYLTVKQINCVQVSWTSDSLDGVIIIIASVVAPDPRKNLVAQQGIKIVTGPNIKKKGNTHIYLRDSIPCSTIVHFIIRIAQFILTRVSNYDYYVYSLRNVKYDDKFLTIKDDHLSVVRPQDNSINKRIFMVFFVF